MKAILVPTDYSEHALNAVRYALAYAEMTRSKVILLHVYEDSLTAGELVFTGLQHSKRQVFEQAERKMRGLVSSFMRKTSTRMEWVLRAGNPSQQILEYARQKKIKLVIMGTTGKGYLARTVFGSTTQAVISRTLCPVITVPHTARFKSISRIAIAVDNNPDSLLTIQDAVGFARRFQANAMFMHIIDTPQADGDAAYQEMVYQAKKRMRYKHVSFHVYAHKNVLKGLDILARKERADLLSMAIHKRHFPEMIWNKGLTNRMTNMVNIPILVIPVPAV